MTIVTLKCQCKPIKKKKKYFRTFDLSMELPILHHIIFSTFIITRSKEEHYQSNNLPFYYCVCLFDDVDDAVNIFLFYSCSGSYWSCKRYSLLPLEYAHWLTDYLTFLNILLMEQLQKFRPAYKITLASVSFFMFAIMKRCTIFLCFLCRLTIMVKSRNIKKITDFLLIFIFILLNHIG